MSITEAVSVRLESILKERGMKKTEFKELPGVKAQSVSNIFRTKSMPSITMTTLHRISRALDMTMAEFMDDPIFDNIQIDD
jgi:DNA-binding Xre family transcriptional regulator